MIRACCKTSSRAFPWSTRYETKLASAKPAMKIANSAALNFQTRFTRAPVACSRGYFLGVSHGQCHVLSGSFGFSGSFGGGGGGGAGSVFGLAAAVHSGMTLALA